MKLDFEYGQGLMSANLPDNTDIFVPGETVPDPECLPQDWDTLYGETLKSIRNPIGMKPLRELAHKGSTVSASCASGESGSFTSATTCAPAARAASALCSRSGLLPDWEMAMNSAPRNCNGAW